MPLPSEIARVYNARPIRRKFWTCLPVGLLVMNFFGVGVGVDHPAVRHGRAPDPAGAMYVSVVRNEDDVFPIRRPRRRYLVIELRVVIARKRADVFFSELADGLG